MLSKLIIRAYSLLIEVSLWVLLVAALVAGYQFYGLTGLFLAFFGWVLGSIIVFGFFLVLLDIRNKVGRIEGFIKENVSTQQD